MKPIFLTCSQCSAVLEVIGGSREKLTVSGSPFEELTPNTSDGAVEKHLPVVERDGCRVTVKVGSVFHPMTPEHSIEWVYLETKKGSQLIRFTPQDEPSATFVLAEGDEPVAAYAYCNLHGFWKTDIQ